MSQRTGGGKRSSIHDGEKDKKVIEFYRHGQEKLGSHPSHYPTTPQAGTHDNSIFALIKNAIHLVWPFSLDPPTGLKFLHF
jgi:hypothetical protein